MKRIHALVASTAIAVTGFGLATAAKAAADNGSAQVTEVIVTAQKREQKVQDVPLAITAFNSQTIKNASVLNLTDLDGKIPNVTLEAVATFPNASSFSIRGLGFGDVESTFEPTVGVELNGVYLARNVGATQDLFDVNSIEVLRGPQGTLDGANTIGGVVAITTKKPTGRFGGEMEVTAGDRGRVEVRAALEAPLIKDVLSARISVLDLNYDGFLHNIYNDKPMGSVHDLSEMAAEHGLELKVTVLENAREAQNAPSYYGVFSLVWNGRLLADHYVSKGRFKNLLQKEILKQGGEGGRSP